MEKYTEQLENIKYEISPEDDNYTEELLLSLNLFVI